MRYEVSERISTGWTDEQILERLAEQFQKIADKIERRSHAITARGIEATFGSINRTDDTEVTIRRTDDGVLVVADVHYRPSVWFWLFLILLLFTYVGWLIPIAFYLYQKGTVEKAIANALTRVKNEATSAAAPRQQPQSALDELAKLADLRDRGAISDTEFEAKKASLLA